MLPKPKEPNEEGHEIDEKVNPSEEKTDRSYYYDDAHGYENFDPSDDEDSDSDEEECDS